MLPSTRGWWQCSVVVLVVGPLAMLRSSFLGSSTIEFGLVHLLLVLVLVRAEGWLVGGASMASGCGCLGCWWRVFWMFFIGVWNVFPFFVHDVRDQTLGG